MQSWFELCRAADANERGPLRHTLEEICNAILRHLTLGKYSLCGAFNYWYVQHSAVPNSNHIAIDSPQKFGSIAVVVGKSIGPIGPFLLSGSYTLQTPTGIH